MSKTPEESNQKQFETGRTCTKTEQHRLVQRVISRRDWQLTKRENKDGEREGDGERGRVRDIER